MKKILFINDFIYGGGVEKVMHDIVNYLSDKQYDITVFTIYDDKSFYNHYSYSVKHITFGQKRGERIHKYSILRRAKGKLTRFFIMNKLNREHYDTIVAIKEGKSAIIASKIRCKCKKLAWIHTDYDKLHWTKSIFKTAENERLLLSQFDNVVCVSQTVMENVKRAIGDPGNLIVRYNAVDIEDIINKSSELCECTHPGGKPLFVTVGRLRAQKGYPELIKVCAGLRKNFDFELWIIGDSDDTEYKTMMQAIVADNNLGDTVFFLGNKQNPYPYVKQADWFICSSVWESFGIAIQEALILGVPIITTNCPGACELLENEYSIVVNDMNQMKGELSRILSDSSLTDKYKKGVKQYYRPVPASERLHDIEILF